ncbi:MAG: hypothetical protein C7B44_11655 [Sulfobacillus thermosulfidooxidans]|nr:MAG: hypothetical protein C7B44_11655 [Sulfobacillus thermosulfidooxidans]
MSANVLGRFAWHYHGPQQGPIQNGDMLLLIKLEPSDRAKWVLAGAPRTPTVLMKIMDGDTVVYVHPETYEPATVPAQLHGIVQIIRAMV